MLSWYCFQIFFSPLVTIPVAPMITGMTKYFMFHIRWISILKFLYYYYYYYYYLDELRLQRVKSIQTNFRKAKAPPTPKFKVSQVGTTGEFINLITVYWKLFFREPDKQRGVISPTLYTCLLLCLINNTQRKTTPLEQQRLQNICQQRVHLYALRAGDV
jgi:hypothetical protein